MKIKIIDLANAIYENRIKEGFRCVHDDKVYTYEMFDDKSKLVTKRDISFPTLPHHNLHILNILEEEIEIITPDLMEQKRWN